MYLGLAKNNILIALYCAAINWIDLFVTLYMYDFVDNKIDEEFTYEWRWIIEVHTQPMALHL